MSPHSTDLGPSVRTSTDRDSLRSSFGRGQNDQASSKRSTLLSVIIPVFNEQTTINEIISRVVDLPIDKEIIVVDDGSTDETPHHLNSWSQHPLVRTAALETNQGKGAAIRHGIGVAQGKFVVVQDADLEYEPRDLVRLLPLLISGKADVVYGSRYLGHQTKHPHLVSRYGVALLNLLVWLLYRVRLSDEATCYKATRTELLRRMDLRCNRFEFCPEVTAKACRMGLSIAEVPISYSARDYDAGKKIRLRDGLTAITTLWRYRRWRESVSVSPWMVARDLGE